MRNIRIVSVDWRIPIHKLIAYLLRHRTSFNFIKKQLVYFHNSN